MNDQQVVQELAYQIWESEGRPEGQADKHWNHASILAHIENKHETNSQPEKSIEQQQPDQT